MMCVTRSRCSSSRSRGRSERSSMICVVGAGTGSSPIARCPAAASRCITTRPTKPLEPVTSVRFEVMRLVSCLLCRARNVLSPIARPQRHVGERLARVGSAANKVYCAYVLLRDIALEFDQRVREHVVSAKLNRGGNLDRARAGEHHARDIEAVLSSVDPDQGLVTPKFRARG